MLHKSGHLRTRAYTLRICTRPHMSARLCSTEPCCVVSHGHIQCRHTYTMHFRQKPTPRAWVQLLLRHRDIPRNLADTCGHVYIHRVSTNVRSHVTYTGTTLCPIKMIPLNILCWQVQNCTYCLNSYILWLYKNSNAHKGDELTSISSLLGQISRRNTALPSLAWPVSKRQIKHIIIAYQKNFLQCLTKCTS